MQKSVLITTSGIGERLGNLTKFTNKSLVNVGDKYALCYIIENYDINTEFIITIGYYGNLVKEFLLLSYPTRNFIFVEIDNYNEPGSSLGYSLLQTKNFLQKPFIFHCCDSIIIKPITFEKNKNTLCVAKHNSCINYTNIKGNDEYLVKEINNKNCDNFDYVYTGISFIYDYDIFWKNLESIYICNKWSNTLSDVDVVRKMMNDNKINFHYIVLDDWYDTGNVDSYKILQETFKSTYDVLYKPTESLCFFENSVIKFVNDKEINQKRSKRGKHLFPLTPKIFDTSDNFIIMEKIDGVILSDYYQHGEIYKLLNWAKTNLWKNENKNDIYKNECYEFYINKTKKRINSLNFLKNNIEIQVVNGVNVGTFEELIEKVSIIDNIFTDTFYNFHGDFILDNVIKTTESYILIDWRHEFGNQLIYGDIYYDLAKLRHNIIFNHKNILQNLYECNYKKNGDIIIDLKCNYFLMQQLTDFDRFINENGYDLKKIKILTSIIWLNMSPLYEGKLSEFLFYFGKYNIFISIQ